MKKFFTAVLAAVMVVIFGMGVYAGNFRNMRNPDNQYMMNRNNYDIDNLKTAKLTEDEVKNLYDNERLALERYKKLIQLDGWNFPGLINSKENNLKLIEDLARANGFALSNKEIQAQNFKDADEALSKIKEIEEKNVETLKDLIKKEGEDTDAGFMLNMLLRRSERHLYHFENPDANMGRNYTNPDNYGAGCNYGQCNYGECNYGQCGSGCGRGRGFGRR